MKTTLDLPEELVREMKLRAAREGKKLREVATEVVRRGLATQASLTARPSTRVTLPLLDCEREDRGGELSPELLADVLLDQEAGWIDDATRR